MVKYKTCTVETTEVFQMINITDEVSSFVEASGITDGVCYVISKHTTTAILVNESLPCVEKDIEDMFERLVPTHAPYVHTHMLPTYGTCSGNAPGHLKSAIGGYFAIMPVIGGKLVRGGAQDIYFTEMDGLQKRSFTIMVMGE
ncbi:MAG: YjbQ family protein [Firmicutes bacterium]|jgi:secondary thiamine-phosphate synthase enzyme|nr:YjbQ family protein [Bacillota bacterium]MBQ2058606.1 YjbQ family protein [Bacillota bacterium]MBQ4372119.1 YjbQ family protein [Bacillota bacterium]